MGKQDDLKVFEPILKQLGNAITAKDYLLAIENIANEIDKWKYPQGREIEIEETYKELMKTLGEYSLRRIKGESNEQLTNEIRFITELINGLYDFCHR